MLANFRDYKTGQILETKNRGKRDYKQGQLEGFQIGAKILQIGSWITNSGKRDYKPGK